MANSVQGLDKLFKKLDSLSNDEFTNMVDVAMKRTVSKLRSIASDNAPINRVKHGGELRRSIHSKTAVDGSKVVGTVFSNKDYALYVELGTGPKGRDNHKGISPHVNPTYRNTPWVIPLSGMNEKLGSGYNLRPVTKNGQLIGHFTSGMSARPFMYQAISDNEESLKRLFARQIFNEIKRLGIK